MVANHLALDFLSFNPHVLAELFPTRRSSRLINPRQ